MRHTSDPRISDKTISRRPATEKVSDPSHCRSDAADDAFDAQASQPGVPIILWQARRSGGLRRRQHDACTCRNPSCRPVTREQQAPTLRRAGSPPSIAPIGTLRDLVRAGWGVRTEHLLTERRITRGLLGLWQPQGAHPAGANPPLDQRSGEPGAVTGCQRASWDRESLIRSTMAPRSS